MSSVTGRIKQISKPGRFITKKNFTIRKIDDGITLYREENIHAGTVGIAVEYLSKFLLTGDKENAFRISLAGALMLDRYSDEYPNILRIADELLESISGIDETSIISACKLAGFDVCVRSSIEYYKPIEEINPDKYTIRNIEVMLNRINKFWSEYGPVNVIGYAFPGAYTNLINTGDGDFLTEDTLWDFSVSIQELQPKKCLQELVYYIMGKVSDQEIFNNISNIGVFNPRLNTVYTLDVNKDISSSVIANVAHEVIGYEF